MVREWTENWTSNGLPMSFGKKLSFASVHLDDQSDAERQLQVKALNEFLLPIPHPVILAGDLNATPPSPTMKLVASAWSVVPKLNPVLTVPSDDPKIKIDYIVTRNIEAKGSSIKVIAEPMASDHRPVTRAIPWQ